MAGYMGDKASMIVHHLAQMTTDCRIYYIKKENRLYFVPDTVDQAIKEKFVPCTSCIP
ncbi:MAG: hypothetical protein HPQ69_01350 [Marine Group I thaumarchaeote]|nr:MAG: hypothetical protein HPQ69_01350 [Marine Group I thaumarchaeote]